MAAVANEIERGNAVVVASDSFAVEDAGPRAQAGQRLDDQRKAVGEVIAGAAKEPHALTILAADNPEAVVLDLMQPRTARRQRFGFGREARRDEAARKGTRMGKHDAAINKRRWPRLEGPRRRARYAAGGGGGGFGGLGSGGFGGLGCSMATRQMKRARLSPAPPPPS